MTTMPRKTNDSAFDVGIFVFGNVGTPVIENMVDITDNVDSDRIVNIVATSTVVVIDGSVGNCLVFSFLGEPLKNDDGRDLNRTDPGR